MSIGYVAFRVDTDTIKDGRIVDGWFIKGQREDTYNWELLGEAHSEEGAKEMARGYRERLGSGQLVTIYNPSGREYQDLVR